MQGGYCHYFAPDQVSGLIRDEGGIRADVGYSFDLPCNLSVPVYVESGYSHLVGTNPILLDVKSVPLVLFGGLEFSLFDFFSLRASLGLGAMFSTVEHYESVLDMAKDNLSVSTGTDFLFAFRAGLGFCMVENLASLFADFGLDLILENDGPIPLPALTVGLRLHQVKFSSRKKDSAVFTEKNDE